MPLLFPLFPYLPGNALPGLPGDRQINFPLHYVVAAGHQLVHYFLRLAARNSVLQFVIAFAARWYASVKGIIGG